MTEQQAQNPVDDLFRNAFENLPDTPAASGWDTPSDQVWQHVQSNIQAPRKGWGMQSYALLAIFAVTLSAGLYWMFAQPTEKPAAIPSVTPVEQPVVTPDDSAEKIENQTIATPNSSTGNAKPPSPSPRNSTEEKQAKPGENKAQPLPGSKQTLPPNTTEAQKKQGGGN